ncbi:MAG: putative secretion system transrane protein 2 [Rhodocyclales bacterium]|nr:putative secretion system transrane protein 2 [Rhodocyclales bacterium]
MVGMNPRGMNKIANGIFHIMENMAWEFRRGGHAFSRRFGRFGFLLIGFCAVALGAWAVHEQQTLALADIQRQAIEHARAPARPREVSGQDGRVRLKVFEDYLLPQALIPTAVERLLSLAEEQHLTILRGEYRPQSDIQGKFLRYQMTLPVKGNAAAIYHFMDNALHAEKTLALQSVQFKRERIESTDIEARIQWVLLTRLPEYSIDTKATADPGGKSQK